MNLTQMCHLKHLGLLEFESNVHPQTVKMLPIETAHTYVPSSNSTNVPLQTAQMSPLKEHKCFPANS